MVVVVSCECLHACEGWLGGNTSNKSRYILIRMPDDARSDHLSVLCTAKPSTHSGYRAKDCLSCSVTKKGPGNISSYSTGSVIYLLCVLDLWNRR